MSDIEIHTVILDNQYTTHNQQWLCRFAFHKKQEGLSFFSCFSYSVLGNGFVEFEVLLLGKATEERQRVLLPLHAVVAILLDESRKSQFGFHQEKIHDNNP